MEPYSFPYRCTDRNKQAEFIVTDALYTGCWDDNMPFPKRHSAATRRWLASALSMTVR